MKPLTAPRSGARLIVVLLGAVLVLCVTFARGQNTLSWSPPQGYVGPMGTGETLPKVEVSRATLPIGRPPKIEVEPTSPGESPPRIEVGDADPEGSPPKAEDGGSAVPAGLTPMTLPPVSSPPLAELGLTNPGEPVPKVDGRAALPVAPPPVALPVAASPVALPVAPPPVALPSKAEGSPTGVVAPKGEKVEKVEVGGAPAGGAAPKSGGVGAAPAVFVSRPETLGGITQIGCTSCGKLPPIAPLTGLGGDELETPGCGGCGEAGCVPGRAACETCEGHDPASRLWCAFHNALCCPDPCYEPQWVPAANAALFVSSVRPSTYTRLRWDYGNDLTNPDRAEYFWKAPGNGGPNAKVNGATVTSNRVNYHELSLYAEAGTEKFSFFIDTPYRNLNGDLTGGAGSFGDLSLGTKSVLIDSDLLLTTFQFTTTVPVGDSGHGLGTGHVSLDPSLLYAVKLCTDTYWQGQLGYWIPIGATSGYSGGVVEYFNSLNYVLWRPIKDTTLIGTLESTGYTFTAGKYTNAFGVVESAKTTYFNLGPGVRFSVCDKLDIGFGIQFALTKDHGADQLYRTELRWRF